MLTVTRILNILPVVILTALVLVPAVSAAIEEALQVFPENDTEGYLPVDIISIDPAIKDATPYYDLLILSDEGKNTWLESIDNLKFDTNNRNISEEFKNQLKTKLNGLWEKYPVAFVSSPGSSGYPTYGGSIITIRFKNESNGAKLTDAENNILEQVQILINYDYQRSHNLTTSDPSSYPGRIPFTYPTPLPVSIVVTSFLGAVLLIVKRLR
jgi:hypothetical protein